MGLNNIKRYCYYPIFLIFASIALFIFLELSFSGLYYLTGSPKFKAIPYDKHSPEILDAKEDFFKIAVFGGSAAQGYPLGKNFSDIIEYELKKRYPHREIFVKNYARTAYPFHRHQAELLKALIDKYDMFLIYAGNNEAWNYLDDTGYFRTKEFKDKQVLVTFSMDNYVKRKDIIDTLISTRSFGVFLKSYQKIVQKFFTKLNRDAYSVNRFRSISYQEFELEGAVPFEEIMRMKNNFRSDLEEIGELALKHGKKVLISSVAVKEQWKPFYSVPKESLTSKEKDTFNSNFKRGKENYERGLYNDALTYLFNAYAIDPDLSILNYFIGLSYSKFRRPAEADLYFKRAVDEDGIPLRALRALNRIAEETTLKYDSMYFVDSEKLFDDLISSGTKEEDLFFDVHHPNFLGHTIIATNFLYAMADLESWEGLKGSVKIDDFEGMAKEYMDALSISSDLETYADLMVARWHLSMAEYSAYKEDFLKIAEAAIKRFYKKSNPIPQNEATYFMYQGLIEAQRKTDRDLALSYINRSLEASLKTTLDIFCSSLAGGRPVTEMLGEIGISYDDKRQHFIVKELISKR
ncbi:hypothetical protein ACFLZ3_03190 [Candidatus Omnitrophota bacterium]